MQHTLAVLQPSAFNKTILNYRQVNTPVRKDKGRLQSPSFPSSGPGVNAILLYGSRIQWALIHKAAAKTCEFAGNTNTYTLSHYSFRTMNRPHTLTHAVNVSPSPRIPSWRGIKGTAWQHQLSTAAVTPVRHVGQLRTLRNPEITCLMQPVIER